MAAVLLVAITSVITGFVSPNRDPGLRDVDSPSEPPAIRSLGQLPVAFEANVGQEDPEVRFRARTGATSLFLTDTEAVFDVAGDAAPVRWRLVGVDPDARPAGLELRTGVTNYYGGPDRATWFEGVPRYGRVVYGDAYPGIDIVYYGSGGGQLEYDFVVAPGADPALIAVAFEGAEVHLDDAGDLVVGPALRHRRPIVYQDVAGGRRAVDASYVLDGGIVRFGLGPYDRSLPLVIDPIIYSTYLGGDDHDNGQGIAVDASGQAVITGPSPSSNFPTRNPIPGTSGPGGFVAKLNAGGTDLLFSTHLRMSGGSSGRALALDDKGNAYVTGVTGKPFPTTPGAFQACEPAFPGDETDRQAFVVKLSPTGSLIYSTCLGGNGGDVGLGIAVDGGGHAYVTGSTSSTNFPLANQLPTGATLRGEYDGFVTKLNPTGTGAIYSTYLGGSLIDASKGIGVDGAGNAYVSGITHSADFPVAGGLDAALGGERDLFVAKLSSSGSSLTYSRFLGGSGPDGVHGVDGQTGFAVDGQGNAFVASMTSSSDFPVAGAAYQGAPAGGTDVVVSKLSPSGALSYSTYLGGSSDDGGSLVGLALGGDGRVHLLGQTVSANFPLGRADPPLVVPPPSAGGFASPLFVSTLSADGSTLVSSTYFGTGNEFSHLAIAVDGAGIRYLTGGTNGSDFPTTAGAFQTALAPNPFNAKTDAFITKLDPDVGFLRVTTKPPLPSQISVDGVPRATYGIINLEAAPGAHQVCFREVEGFAAPPCQTVNVNKGATTQVEGAFVAKGFLQVVTSPAVPAKISVDGVPRDDWGIFTDLAVGSHDVCFGPVAGFAPPPCQTVNVTGGATTQVTGNYASSPGAPGEPAGNGALRVTTNPPLPSQISVDGVPRATYGIINLRIAAGSHDVCFRAVEGFSAPTCQSVNITAGGTSQVQGNFVAKGFLQAVTSPAGPAPVYVDGVPRDDWGLFTDYTTGSHTVCFGSVARRVRPPCQTVTLNAGQTTQITGTYTAA